MRRVVHGVVRSAVRGEADTGDARGATATSRSASEAKTLTNAARSAVARRTRRCSGRCRRTQRAAGPSGARSERTRTEATGIAAEIDRREIAAESPAAKRVAQNHRTVNRTGIHHWHHRLHQHLHHRRRHQHCHRRRHDRQHHRRRHRHAASIAAGGADTVNTDAHTGNIMSENVAAGTVVHKLKRGVPALVTRRLHDVVRKLSGGAAAERGAAGVARSEGEPRGVVDGSDQKERADRAGATRPALCAAVMRRSVAPGFRGPGPCRPGCR